MKQKIIAALAAKYEGVSEKILGRIAEKLAKTVTTDEEAQTAVGGVSFQQVLEAYGDSRATEAQQTAVRNYEAKYGLKDGVRKPAEGGDPDANPAPDPQPNKKADGGNEIPAWANALIESNKALNERITAMQGERVTADRKGQLAEIYSALPQSVRKAYERTPVNALSDEEFQTLKDEVAAEVAEFSKETAARGAVFGKPTVQGGSGDRRTVASGGKEAAAEEVDAVAERLGV